MVQYRDFSSREILFRTCSEVPRRGDFVTLPLEPVVPLPFQQYRVEQVIWQYSSVTQNDEVDVFITPASL